MTLITTPGRRTGTHRGPGEWPAKIKIVASLWPKCVIYKYSSSPCLLDGGETHKVDIALAPIPKSQKFVDRKYR